jgi:hypothetical protein
VTYEVKEEATGNSWEQGYQYVDMASVDGDVLKVNYFVDLEVTIANNLGLSKQTRNLKVPI